MSHFFHPVRRSLLSLVSTIIPVARSRLPAHHHYCHHHSYGTASQITEMRKSAFQENLLRILRTEIDYELELRPPKEPAKNFGSFTVEDRPGEQYVQLARKYGVNENIKVDVTMFDGFSSTSPDDRNDDPGGDMKLHISMIVDVSKGDESKGVLQFICSAWPDALVVQKVFLYRRDLVPRKPFMGPDFKELDDELQEAVVAYLGERGLNDDLAAFLHEYMTNKDAGEHVRWMEDVKAYVEK